MLGAQAIHDALNLEKTAVSGHVAEIARCFYSTMKAGLDVEEAFTPELLAQATGMGQQAFAVRAMERWKDELGEVYNYDARDLLYWENRMGSWLASSQQEFLLAWKEIFSPFNCQRLLVAALSVDPELRGEPDYPFFRSVIARLWPECLELPINLTLPAALAKRVRRFGRRTLKKLFK